MENAFRTLGHVTLTGSEYKHSTADQSENLYDSSYCIYEQSIIQHRSKNYKTIRIPKPLRNTGPRERFSDISSVDSWNPPFSMCSKSTAVLMYITNFPFLQHYIYISSPCCNYGNVSSIKFCTQVFYIEFILHFVLQPSPPFILWVLSSL